MPKAIKTLVSLIDYRLDNNFLSTVSTPQPLYNTVRYNTVRYNKVLDITRISVGPQLVILELFSYITIHFTLVITRFG